MKTWQDEFKNSIRNKDELNQFIATYYPEKKIYIQSDFGFKSFIPVSYLHHILSSSSQILEKEFFPSQQEEKTEQGLVDPIGDFVNAKGGGVIHRYENRILFSPTKICPIHCRYCFRKNEFDSSLLDADWVKTKEYLTNHSEVNEIIFTGGDPLILSNQKINHYLYELMEFENLRFVRFHTRTPIILPNRIDEEFINMIQKYENHFDKIQLVIHVNHLDELTPEFKYKMLSIKSKKLDWLAQTVLLKNINDDAQTLYQLYSELLKLGITPYYLHHPDQVKGAMHFTLDLNAGNEIYKQLRNQLPGWAIPQYVVDSPTGKSLVSDKLLEHFYQTSPTNLVFSEQIQKN